MKTSYNNANGILSITFMENDWKVASKIRWFCDDCGHFQPKPVGRTCPHCKKGTAIHDDPILARLVRENHEGWK